MALEVPAHEAHVLAPRQNRYCLIIPVINEGQKIRRQLERLAAASFPVDVIIADGGSTDGSLEHGFLRTAGVRALLVKTGPGRLSAQLRVGFAFALQEGYEGAITIDGNGKDGIEAIPAMIEKLDEGYDFVQGSRYLPGGRAINTPLDRTLAVKLIHAPLVSLGAGRRYTDTTNGFRAHSRRLLASPDMAIFRDVFATYNLLFYIAVRAARLGMRVTELPVTRAYPRAGVTPTKISGLKGRIGIVRELLTAVTGGYSP